MKILTSLIFSAIVALTVIATVKAQALPSDSPTVESLYVTDCPQAQSGNWEQIQNLIRCLWGPYADLVIEISNQENGSHICERGSNLIINGQPKYWGLMQIDINYASKAGKGDPKLGLACLQDCKCSMEFAAIDRAKHLNPNGSIRKTGQVNFCQWGPYVLSIHKQIKSLIKNPKDYKRIPKC